MEIDDETEATRIGQRLRYDESACRVLADLVEKLADEREDDAGRQMDRTYGVAYLIKLLGLSIRDAHQHLLKEPPSR